MTTRTTENVHHEAIVEHLDTYRTNLAFCQEQYKSALRAGRNTGAAGWRIWRQRAAEYEAKIETLESILTYVEEAR